MRSAGRCGGGFRAFVRCGGVFGVFASRGVGSGRLLRCGGVRCACGVGGFANASRCGGGRRRSGVTGLAQEAQIGPVDVRGVGLKDVVGKENVRDFVVGDVGLHVFGEVARVDDVNLGEGVEEVAGEGVAEAVFEDDESAVAGRGGADDGQTGVAAHEGAVGAGASIAIMLEIDATARMTFADDAIVLVDRVVNVGGRVGDVARHVVDEVFGGIFERNVLGIGIHAAHIAVNDFAIVGAEGAEGDAGDLGKGLGGVESAEGCPVVVGAEVDVLSGVLAEGSIDINGLDAGIEEGVGGTDVGVLRTRDAARFVGAVIFDGGGDEHAIDVHAREGGMVEVGGAGIADAAFAAATEGHESADVFPAAGDDDAGVGDFGVVVGREMVLIGLDVWIRGAGFGLGEGIAGHFRGFGFGSGGVKCDVFLAGGEGEPVFDFHAQGHEMIAEGFAVAKPG